MNILKTSTVTHSIVTVSGTIINGILGILFYVLVARILGPSDFGILTVSVLVLTLIADIGNLGSDTGLIRFVPQYLQKDKESAYRFMKLGLYVKIVVSILILVVGWFVAPIVAENILLKPNLVHSLHLAMIGVGGAMLFSFVTYSIQAMQRFMVWSFLNISMNGFRLLSVILLFMLSQMSLQNVLVIYITVPLLGFFIGLILLPNFLKVKNEMSVAGEFFHYNKWITLLSVFAAFSSRLDTFILARKLPELQVGIYSAANQLISFVPQLSFALASVVAPKLAGFDSPQKAIIYLKKLQLMVCGLVFLGILALPLFSFAIPIILGSSYQQSTVVFIILLLASLIFLLSLPAHQAIFYYFSKPRFFVFTSLVHILIISILGWFLTINLGITGMALAVLAGSIFNFIIPGVFVIYQFRKRK